MSIAADIFDSGPKQRPPLPVGVSLQNIASAAHLRGVWATRQSMPVTEIPAGDFMRALRGAWEATAGQDAKRTQVENIINGVVVRLQQGGPVLIAKNLLGICVAYRLAYAVGGAKPVNRKREEMVGKSPKQGKRRAQRRKARRW